MTKNEVLALKDEFQQGKKQLHNLLVNTHPCSLQEMNLETTQADAMRTVLDCLQARIELARGQEK